MKKMTVLLFLQTILLAGFAQKIKPEGKIIVNNPLIHQLIAEDAKIEILGDGFTWIEGPCWLPTENKLLFSDIPENKIFEWTEKDGIKLYLTPSGYTDSKKRGGEIGSNGLILSPDNELILCQHGDRSVAKMDADLAHPKADFTILSNSYNGKKLNSPNDGVFAKNGDFFFTDPPYGLEHLFDDSAKEMNYQGVYKVDNNGNTILLTKDIPLPNGIGLSPDEKKMYIAVSDIENPVWMVYDVTPDHQIKNGKIFCDASDAMGKMPGNPDGMAIHKSGWLFASGPGGIWIITEDGEHLGTIYTGDRTSNCVFNEDYSYVYMTANHQILRMKLKTH
ncbi:MAG TPA: SMP-30/gluconolactonase/LRE family protein [Draconibacterium sp.]|nr:SMP-30/gluconolactonase/LRE family protein [Draconibacterium sp.]